MLNLSGELTFLKLDITVDFGKLLLFRKDLGKRKEKLEKKGEKGGKIPPGYPRTKLKIPGFFSQA